MTVAILSLAATVGLLISFNSKSVLQWQWHAVTLNTIVSILTTLSKTLLLFILSSCLGQWKNISFAKQQRDLIGFSILDSASRGPAGSFVLLWHTKLAWALIIVFTYRKADYHAVRSLQSAPF